MAISFPRWRCFFAGVLAACWLVGMAQTATPDIRIFPEKERKAMLRAYWTRMSQPRSIQAATLQDWQARRAMLQRQVMAGFGLDPLPPKVPLNLTYGDRLEREDCTITRVAYQTFPGFYATAFLYMPKRAVFPAPAVLHPHGHWANWSADDIVQSRCIGLARRGYVSLVIQYEHFEDLATGLPMRGVFLWNNMRGLDVLASLPQVDSTRIGVTGASGGGMQSTDIAALDSRVRCAAIVAFPTYYSRVCYESAFGCCYYSPLNALRFMDQQDLIAMIAPKPAAVFTLTGDWTALSIEQELPEVASVYDLFPDPAGPSVANVTVKQPYRLLTSKTGRFLAERWDGPHDYTKAMRERMYWWMDWWLKDRHDAAPAQEEHLNLEPTAKLQALQVRVPEAHQWSCANLASVARGWRRFSPPALVTKADITGASAKLRATLTELLGETALPVTVESATVGEETVGGWHIEKLWFASEPGVRIPALLVTPAGATATARPVTVVVSANGKNDIFHEPLKTRVQALLEAKRAVLALDQRLRGEWAYAVRPPGTMPELTWQGNVRAWGRPELGMAVRDIRMAITVLTARKDCTPDGLQVIGAGHTAGYASLLAAALDERIHVCDVDLNCADFAQGYSDPSAAAPSRAPVLAGILRLGDVGEVAALVAPRALTLRQADPRTSLHTAEATYRVLGAAGLLHVLRQEEGAVVVNGGFEEGARGWTTENGTITLASDQVDLGKASLRLAPGQTVVSDPMAVTPLTQYRLLLRVCKPVGALTIALERGATRFIVGSDWTERMTFEECQYDFATRPGERSVRIRLAAGDERSTRGPVFVDDIRLVVEKPLTLLKPDGKEWLSAVDVSALAPGTEIGTRHATGAFFIPYGPGSVHTVVAEGREGRRAVYLKSGLGTYAALSSPLREPLQRGGLYRFQVTARGKGTLNLCFFWVPPGLAPRLDDAILTDDWKTYSLDFFVESGQQCNALPTVNVTGDMWIDRISMQVIEPVL